MIVLIRFEFTMMMLIVIEKHYLSRWIGRDQSGLMRLSKN